MRSGEVAKEEAAIYQGSTNHPVGKTGAGRQLGFTKVPRPKEIAVRQWGSEEGIISNGLGQTQRRTVVRIAISLRCFRDCHARPPSAQGRALVGEGDAVIPDKTYTACVIGWCS